MWWTSSTYMFESPYEICILRICRDIFMVMYISYVWIFNSSVNPRSEGISLWPIFRLQWSIAKCKNFCCYSKLKRLVSFAKSFRVSELSFSIPLNRRSMFSVIESVGIREITFLRFSSPQYLSSLIQKTGYFIYNIPYRKCILHVSTVLGNFDFFLQNLTSIVLVWTQTRRYIIFVNL